jgi:hypothetical protein
MASLMLINPRRRRKTAHKAKTNPRRRRAHAATTAKRHYTHHTKRVRRNPIHAVRRHVRRHRRNPAARAGGIMHDIMQAGIGAIGAVGVNMLYDLVPLPSSMKTGMGATVGKAAAAVLVGMAARPILGRAAGTMAQGALTVIAYDAIKGMMSPSASVAGLGYTAPGLPAGYLPQQGMGNVGEYVSTFSKGMGEYVY